MSPTSESSSQLEQTQTHRIRRLWTEEEDEKLRLLVSYWGDQCGRNGHWTKISSHFDNRTPKDCRKRWFHSLDPRHKRGRWTESEDRTLVEAYERLGPQWQRVAQLIPGRTDDQCAKRWSDVLDPRISMRLREWNEEEDRKLLGLIERYGTKWTVISKEMDGRTGLTCRNRWRKLVRMGEKAQEVAERAEFASTNPHGPLPPPPKELSLLETIMPSGEIPAPSTLAYLSTRHNAENPQSQFSLGSYATREQVQSGKTYTLTIEDPESYDNSEGGVGAGTQYALNELDLDKVLDTAAKNNQKIVIHQHIYNVYAGSVASSSGIARRAQGPHNFSTTAPPPMPTQSTQYQPLRQQPQQPKYPHHVPPQPSQQDGTNNSSVQSSRDLTPAIGGLPDEFLVTPGMIFDMDHKEHSDYQLDYLAFNPS